MPRDLFEEMGFDRQRDRWDETEPDVAYGEDPEPDPEEEEEIPEDITFD